MIKCALEQTKRSLAVDTSRDWLTGHYQFCNRVAVLEFLRANAISARLLFVYFTGDRTHGRRCPVDETTWQSALAAQDQHIGLPKGHSLASRIHRLFLPVYVTARQLILPHVRADAPQRKSIRVEVTGL